MVEQHYFSRRVAQNRRRTKYLGEPNKEATTTPCYGVHTPYGAIIDAFFCGLASCASAEASSCLAKAPSARACCSSLTRHPVCCHGIDAQQARPPMKKLNRKGGKNQLTVRMDCSMATHVLPLLLAYCFLVETKAPFFVCCNTYPGRIAMSVCPQYRGRYEQIHNGGLQLIGQCFILMEEIIHLPTVLSVHSACLDTRVRCPIRPTWVAKRSRLQ